MIYFISSPEGGWQFSDCISIALAIVMAVIIFKWSKNK